MNHIHFYCRFKEKSCLQDATKYVTPNILVFNSLIELTTKNILLDLEIT